MELKFKRDTSFRKQFFTPESFAHPAKMDAQLLLWIVERYTQPGEVILDPMAGMGTTMLACTLGRHCVLVELEEKFCKMCKSNWERVGTMPQLGYEMGQCNIVQGDARQLDGLVDKVITSPPYAQGIHPTGENSAEVEKIRPQDYVEHCQARLVNGYGKNPDNIGNLPYGQIDKIVTSPPFGEAQSGGGIARKGYRGPKHGPTDLVGKRSYMPENIGDQDNISNLPYGNIDSIITSPPYEDSLSEPEDRKRSIDQRKWGDGRKIAPPHSQVHLTYPASSRDNIGNLKSESYLEAMLQVYQQCHKVLKPEGGLLILVTKNFIREKKVVRLDEDTIKLCEQAGFSFLERHYRELTSMSFWRRIYHDKFPDVEQIKSEDILVFQRSKGERVQIQQ